LLNNTDIKEKKYFSPSKKIIKTTEDKIRKIEGKCLVNKIKVE